MSELPRSQDQRVEFDAACGPVWTGIPNTTCEVFEAVNQNWRIKNEAKLLHDCFFMDRPQPGPLDIRQESREQAYGREIGTNEIHKIDAGQIREPAEDSGAQSGHAESESEAEA